MSKKATILYIEDDYASQRLVKRVLENQGYEVTIAIDGMEGIALAREKEPQLILMDINLPKMDGQEITTRLRSLPYFADTPIVALTANVGAGSRQQALVSGCTGFLTKPIDVTQFPDQVEAFLQGRMEPLNEMERSEHLEIYAQKLVERLEHKIYELQTANQKLRELDRMKSDFIVLVSHELRTPLTLISGYAYLLKEKVEQANEGEIPASISHVASGLNMGVERLSQVINEIISVSRIAAGNLDLALGPVRLDQTIRPLIAEAKAACEQRGIELQVCDLSTLPVIEGDGGQLRVAINNVISNAIKYTANKGLITIGGRAVGDAVDITIADTGVGIPETEQRRIFEQFHVLGSIQHHSTSKSAFLGGGLGLGLAIARGIVEAHNGRIWVESEGYDPEKMPGSTFHILLPLCQDQS
jgi:signal transduction histidine kinase